MAVSPEQVAARAPTMTPEVAELLRQLMDRAYPRRRPRPARRAS